MDLIERQEAIDVAHKNYDTILDFKSDGRTVADSFEDIINALPSAQPEIVRCKNCKYNPDNPRPFYDDDPIETYAWCKTEYFDEQGFCSCGKLAINLR